MSRSPTTWSCERRAWRWVRCALQVNLRLKKRIPMGAGLGGGSSDAAAVLLALPALAGRTLGLDTLTRLGGELGSDVPFSVGGTTLGVGRGSEVYPLPDLARPPGLWWFRSSIFPPLRPTGRWGAD